jgi:hypothetical protein
MLGLNKNQIRELSYRVKDINAELRNIVIQSLKTEKAR